MMKRLLFILLAVLCSVLCLHAKGVKGDIDGDGTLTLSDVALLKDIILGKQTTSLLTSELDLNSDDRVSVADIVRLVYMVNHKSEGGLDIGIGGWENSDEDFGGTVNAPRRDGLLRAGSRVLSAGYAATGWWIQPGDGKLFDICLDNASDITACQLTIMLPANIDFAKGTGGQPVLQINPARLSSTHVWDCSGVSADNRVTVIVYSTDNSKLKTQDSKLLDFQVKASEGLVLGNASAVLAGQELVEGSNTSTFSVTRPADADVAMVVSVPDYSISLKQGWTWISSSLRDKTTPLSVMNDDVRQKVERFVSQTQELVYDDYFGSLVGNLKTLSPTAMYKVKMSADASLPMNGCVCLPENETVSLNEGWNWLGYLPLVSMPIDDAFALLEASDDDRLIPHTGSFATYYNGSWYPNTLFLQPGAGYMYKAQSAKTFQYPCYVLPASLSATGNAPQKSDGTATATAAWSVDPHKYPNVMAVIAQLYVDDLLVEPEAYTVGAFAGDECRAVGQIVSDRIFLTIYGESSKDEISFRVMDNRTGAIMDVGENFHFGADIENSFRQPYALHASSLTGIGTIAADTQDPYLKTQNRYNLAGQKVGAGYKGIVVKNGKKVLHI